MYELPASLLYSNPLNRYLINSPMLPSLQRDPDGGSTLYFQHDLPGPDKESNLAAVPQWAIPRRDAALLAEASGLRWRMEESADATGQLTAT